MRKIKIKTNILKLIRGLKTQNRSHYLSSEILLNQGIKIMCIKVILSATHFKIQVDLWMLWYKDGTDTVRIETLKNYNLHSEKSFKPIL